MNKELKTDQKITIYRYHPFYIVKPIFRSLVILGIFLGQEVLSFLEEGVFFEDLQIEEIGWALLLGGGIFLLVLLPSLINASITYFKSQVELTEDTIVYKKITFLSKTSKETPLGQITNLNFNRSLLDRVFSTVDVHLDINSSETADESDYSILLGVREAREFKRLFDYYNQKQKHKKHTIKSTRNTRQPINNNYIYQYRSWEIWRHLFLSSSFFIILLIFGIAVFIFTDSLQRFSLFSVFILLFSFAVDIIRNISKFYGYKVKSNQQSINWQSGLFENKEFTISKGNIRALEIKQSLLARLLNYYSVDIKIIGIGNDGEELMTVILYQKRAMMLEVLKEILPEHQLALSFEKENKGVAFYKGLIAWLFTLPLLFIPIIQNYIEIYLLGLVVIMLSYLLKNYGTGFYENGKEIEILSAYFSLQITRLAIKNVDHIKIIKRPLFSRLGLSKIALYYKDNAGANVLITGYFPDQSYTSLLKEFTKTQSLSEC